jgi:hypothetical protein
MTSALSNAGKQFTGHATDNINSLQFVTEFNINALIQRPKLSPSIQLEKLSFEPYSELVHSSPHHKNILSSIALLCSSRGP